MINKEAVGYGRIRIFNEHPTVKLPFSKINLIKFSENIFKKEKKKLKLLLVNFIDNKTIKKINNKYLNHNYNTDVISFNYSPDNNIEGELFISLDSVKNNAANYNVSFRNELLRVLAHGCLHLSGYDDNSDSQKEIITSKENFYLNYTFS